MRARHDGGALRLVRVGEVLVVGDRLECRSRGLPDPCAILESGTQRESNIKIATLRGLGQTL